MLRSPLANPMTTPMINPIRTGLSKITRAILNFNGTQYATLAEDLTFTDGFKVEAFVFFGSCPEGYSFRMWGHEDKVEAGFISYSKFQGELVVREGNAWIVMGGLDLDETIHRVTVTRASGDSEVSVEIDGSLVGTYSVPGTYRIRYLARAYGSDITEFGDNADGNILEFKAWEDSGDLVAEYRLDEPDTIYQRNYASPITDVNDPEWSGAILQNTLLGDWEEVYQESEQTPWKGKNLFTSDTTVRLGGYTEIGNSAYGKYGDSSASLRIAANLTAGRRYETELEMLAYLNSPWGKALIVSFGGAARDLRNLGVGKHLLSHTSKGENLQELRVLAEDEYKVEVKIHSIYRLLEYAEGALL